MRILMTADTVGGVWTYAIELASVLHRHGAEVVLATKGALPTAHQRAEVAECGAELRESSYRLEWMEEPWIDVERASEWLFDLSEEVRPDVIHLNDFAHGILPFAAPVLMVGHSCVLSWFAAVRRDLAPRGWDRYRRVVTAGLRSAACVVAPTTAMLRALEEHYGPLRNARVIPNARRAELFPPMKWKESLVLAAGRLWDDAKNISALEAVAPDLPWPVKLAGDDRAPPASVGGLPAGQCERLGHLEQAELAGWMARAAIYVLPARYEPFGLSVLEAALAGCALVLGDIPSLREVWGDAATFVAPDDQEALARAVRRLTSDSALRSEMAGRARARALEHSPEVFGQAYLQSYRELLVRSALEKERAPCA
jgi:glycogen synthase